MRILDSEAQRDAEFAPAGQLSWLDAAVVNAMGRKLGVSPEDVRLYGHQARAIKTLGKTGGSVILATTTSSGKSLCFQIPWLNDVAHSSPGEAPTALYLAPLNALIDDQFQSLRAFSLPLRPNHLRGAAVDQGFLATVDLGGGIHTRIAQYHGGVPKDLRPDIRQAEPELVFANPEMLSMAMLAYALDVEAPGVNKMRAGGAWKYFFQRLRYVILDECHEMRGVFGSHVANLLRRLRRVCSLAGNAEADRLRYVLCSATIREPGRFAERLIGTKPSLVIERRDDTSERHAKKLVFLRRRDPDRPFKDFALGGLGKVFCNRRLRTIAFQENIPAIEELYDRFSHALEGDQIPQESLGVFAAVFGPEEKAEQLDNLRSGKTACIISTSALALGIDIGALSCSILIGYPGSMAKAWQMLGRAGRRGPGLQLFLLGNTYLDRFWEEHPEEFLDQQKHLDELVIMPDNRYILKEHIAAAHFDFPLNSKRDRKFFGSTFPDVLREMLEQGDWLVPGDEDPDEYFELVDGDRVFKIPLRGSGAFKVPVCLNSSDGEVILQDDQVRAIRRLYQGATFIHNRSFYRVTTLAYESGKENVDEQSRPFYAIVKRASGSKVTVPIIQTTINSLTDEPEEQDLGVIYARAGRVKITTMVNQYYEVPYDPLDPPQEEVAVPQDGEPPDEDGAVSEEPEHGGTKQPPRRFQVTFGPNTPRRYAYETDGMWLVVPAEAFAGIEGDDDQYRALFSVGKAVTRAVPLLHYCGPDDLLFTPELYHEAADGHAAIFIYEQTRGGVGLASRTFERITELLNNALYEVLEGCPRCRDEPESCGCLSCIADISGLHDRRLAIRLLRRWLGEPPIDGAPSMTPEAALQSLGFDEPEEILEGGMGKVYKARRDGQYWAFKMPGGKRMSPQKCAEIAREGLRQKALAGEHPWGQHPNILPVLEVITIDPYVFLQLEYADGGSLHERIGPTGYTPRGARTPAERAHGCVRDILPVIDAVAHMHECGWVHRDIKPGNVLFVGSTVKLADFGIANRQSSEDETITGAGTLGFAAPGQLADLTTADYRDDVYSLGVLLIAMLTGRMPIEGQRLAALSKSTPAELQAIIAQATATDRMERYDTARDLYRELERFAPPNATKRTRRPRRR
ncbi:MAG: DEAD/DEAH box helicase [Rhodopirellula sp.]|nr:DEAD/DEAH box helicase [Rhodopirellula sp.]